MGIVERKHCCKLFYMNEKKKKFSLIVFTSFDRFFGWDFLQKISYFHKKESPLKAGWINDPYLTHWQEN